MSKNFQDKIKDILAVSGGEWVELPSLLPAAVVLEMAGESLRSRLYFATSPDGDELCLRADLTIAAAMKYLNETEKAAVTYLCQGTVFRASPSLENRPVEFNQIGIERFGPQNEITVDVEVFLAALRAAQLGSNDKLGIELSDGDLIRTLLSGAHIAHPWNQFLIDAAKNPLALRRALAIASNPKKLKTTDLGLKLLNLTDDDAASEVQDFLQRGNLQPGLARGPVEIAKRLRASTERAIAKPLESNIKVAIEDLLAIKTTPSQAIMEVQHVAKRLKEDVSEWSKSWSHRIKLMQQAAPEAMERTKFIAGKSGRFEYYSGFNFDIFYEDKREAPISSGGRYDGLITALTNGKRHAQAMGVVIRPERIAN